MSAQVLPKEVRLTAPPTMPQARSYLFKQQSTQSSYTAGSSGNIQINIPRLQRSYLSKDSYLKFKLATTWTNNGTSVGNPVFDTCGAYGLIDTIEVYDYLGSTLLERTSGHAQLMALLMDCHVGGSEMRNHFGATSGCKGMQVGWDPDQPRLNTTQTTAAEVITALGIRKNIVQAPVSGQALGPISVAVSGTSIGQGTNAERYFEFSLPLFSFLGTLSKKYAPLHNGYTINIVLNTVDKVFGMGTNLGVAGGSTFPTYYNLSDVYWCSQVLELGPTAESMLISSTQGQPMVIPAKAYRNYVGTLTSATTNSQYRLDLNLNVASLTNILWIMRPSANFTGATAKFRKSFSYRIRNFLQSWYFQYGSTILPQSSGILCGPPTGGTALDAGFAHSEAYNELMKARHNYSTSNTHSMITPDTFWVDQPIAHAKAYNDLNWANTGIDNTASGDAAAALSSNCLLPPGKFAGGIDLELVPGRSQDLICGMNTNGMNTSIFLNFDSSKYVNGNLYTYAEPAQIDAWAEYDAFINISPGIATTVSF